MEAVRAFNNELFALYEGKPPVSRAKMALLTKCAIKAIKFYKHVVQSVEKFVQKCKPEYKVPGLYVIDSIVRQSRHQFGAEKDVFAPRFTKNVVLTFQNLFKCPPDEKSKVVRVLNLWQKNAVFPVEVIQPLLDLAAEPGNPELVASAQRAVDGIMANNAKTGNSANQQAGEHHSHDSTAAARHDKDIPSANSVLEAQNDMLETVKQLLQQTQKPTSLSAQQQQLQQLQLLQQQLLQQTELMQQPAQQQQAAAIIDSNLLSQIQTLTNQLLNNQIKTSNSKPPEPGFNKKLLDFDYGESDDENEHDETNEIIPGNVQNILNDPTIMQQIHQMSQTIKKTEQLKNELNIQEQLRQQLLKQQEQEFNQQISQDAAPPPTPHHMPVPPQMPPQPPPPTQMIPPQAPNMHPPPMPYYVPEPQYPPPPSQNDLPDHMDLDGRHDRHYNQMGSADVIVIDDQPEIHKPPRNRDRSRSRSPRRKKRSRSRSRSKERRRRSRSRDRDRERGGDRDRDRDRRKRSRSRERERERQREKERERRRKGLPNIKERNLSVCTRTIWLGHVAKVTTEDELRLEIEKYGAVETINMIPPRGCAFVCMARRKDAAKAVEKLKGVKIHSNQLKVAWAPGIGVKDAEYKDLWDVELGVTYIPWEKLPQDLTHLMEGGMIDEETVPDHLKAGLNLDKSDAVETNNLEEPPVVNFKMNEVNLPSAPIAIPPPAAIPPSQPPMQGQPMPRMLMQIPPPAGMMPPMMMPIAPGMPRPPQTGVPPPPLGMAPSSTSQAQVLPPRPVPPVQAAMAVPSMGQTVVLTSVAPSTISNPSMPSLPPPTAVQLSQGIQNTLSSVTVTGGLSVPPRPPPAFTAQLRQQPRPFPPPFQPGAAFRMQMHEAVRGMAGLRPPMDPNMALQNMDKDKLNEANKEEWLKKMAENQNDDQDSEMKLEVGSQEPDTTSDAMLHTPGMPPMSAALQQMLAQRPPPSPAMGLRPHLTPGMGPRPGMNGPPTELRLAGPNGPLLTGPPNRQATIGIPGMPTNISIGPRTLGVEGPPPGFTARMGIPGGPRFAPRGFPPVFPGGPPPGFQGPMGVMLRPPRPDAEGRFPAGTFAKNGTFERANFERTPRPFGPGGPRNERPGGERWMGRDRWGPRDNGPGMRFRREFDQREEFFDRSRYVLDNRDPGGPGGRRGNRFDGDEENNPHHYEDDRERPRHEDDRDRPRRDDERDWQRRDDDRDRSRRGDDRDRSRRDDRDRSRHDEDRERSRHDEDRDRSRHDEDRNRNRHEDRDRFRHGEPGRDGSESGRSRNREDRPRKSRWSDAEDKETPMDVPPMNPAKALDTVPEGVEPPPPPPSDKNDGSEPMEQCSPDVTAPPPPCPEETMTSTQEVPPPEEMAADGFEKPAPNSPQEKNNAPSTKISEDLTTAEDFSTAPEKECPPADCNNSPPPIDSGPTENITPEQTHTPAENFAPSVNEDFEPPVMEDFTPPKENEPAPAEFTPSETIAPSEEKFTESNSPSERVAPVEDITPVVDTVKEVQEPCEPPVQNNDNNNDDNNEDNNEKTEIETD